LKVARLAAEGFVLALKSLERLLALVFLAAPRVLLVLRLAESSVEFLAQSLAARSGRRLEGSDKRLELLLNILQIFKNYALHCKA